MESWLGWEAVSRKKAHVIFLGAPFANAFDIEGWKKRNLGN